MEAILENIDNHKLLAELQLMNAETKKYIKESDKLHAETANIMKNTKYLELTVFVAVIGTLGAVGFVAYKYLEMIKDAAKVVGVS